MTEQNFKSYSVPEAARALGFTLKYIHDLIHAGRLRAEKVERKWRIPAAEIEARLKAKGQQ